MRIPELDPVTGYLPAGEHRATWVELERAFGGTVARRRLLAGLRGVVEELWAREVTRLWIDGSFVTSKARPGDVEVVFEAPVHADTDAWGRLAWEQRAALRKNTGVDLLPYPGLEAKGSRWMTITEFFSTDRSGVPKGLILLTKAGER